MRTYNVFCVLCALVLACGCTQKEKDVSVSSIEEKMVSEIKLEKPTVTDLKGNTETAERYGIPLDKIEEGFAYTNEETGKKADEIVIIKVKDKKDIHSVERALESEITGLATAWEGTDKQEYEKVQKHILRSKGKYVLLAITDESKKVEEIFNSFLG